jgi:hypothetical protein
MENAVMLEIPLEVKLRMGSNWNDLQPYICPAPSLSSSDKGISPAVTSPVDDFPMSQGKEHATYLYPPSREEILATHSHQVVKNLFGNE